MKQERKIADGVYIIGGPDISHAEDATSFIIVGIFYSKERVKAYIG